MHFIGFFDYTVILTYISFASSLVGMVLAYRENLLLAVLCLLFSGFCDLFDGIVARTKKNRTQDEKNFGIQLDSLCDIICFGVFPAILFYLSGVDSALGVVILVLYVLAGLIRLAFFNVLEISRQANEDGCVKYFRGMPITCSSIITPIVFLVGAFLPAPAAHVLYYIAPAVMGFLFVLDIKVPKPDVGALLFGKKK
ncbi:MAG: CDP-alcohol phosphatidyltransferase family protein [Eubacteriales bacterium]